MKDNDNENRAIADNPSSQEMLAALPLLKGVVGANGMLKKVGLTSKRLQSISDAADEVLKQADILHMPDRFNALFLDMGWLATGSLAADTMKRAVELGESGKIDAAEREIVDWFTIENLQFFALNRSKRFHLATNRYFQIKEAIALHEEGRYLSAVPLILICADGMVSDVLGRSPFAADADLECFDSMVGHASALPKLISKMTTGVRKSTDELRIDVNRHGILHGRLTNYGSLEVSCKAWMLFVSLVDWAADYQSQTDRLERRKVSEQTTLADTLRLLGKNRRDREQMDRFVPVVEERPFDTAAVEGGPRFAIEAFLSGWLDRNFGKMAGVVISPAGYRLPKIAGQLRSDCELVELLKYDIVSIKQTTVARFDAYIEGRIRDIRKVERSFEYKITGFRYDADGDVTMPSQLDGTWKVQQNCIVGILNSESKQ